jgi:hypothetical protein
MEPNADMRAMATNAFQMFLALVLEGFTESQALTLVASVLTAGIPRADPDAKT